MDNNPDNANGTYMLVQEFLGKQVKVFTTNGAALTGKLSKAEGKQLIVCGKHGCAYVNLDHVISITSH